MIYEKCPNCESGSLGDLWRPGRKLQQHCYDCEWYGEVRTPELQAIKTKITAVVGLFKGFHYEVYDRFGHIMAYSQYYGKFEEAEKALKRDMERSATDMNAGPYTGVLYPATVEVEGKVYK